MMLAIAVARHLDATVDGLAFDESGPEGNVFIGHMPASPDLAVMVMPTGGLPQLGRQPTDLPTLQILVRGLPNDPVSGADLATAIYSRLACLDLATLDEGGPDECFVSSCTAQQSAPVGLGVDTNRRHEWSLNFQLRVHAPTVHRT